MEFKVSKEVFLKDDCEEQEGPFFIQSLPSGHRIVEEDADDGFEESDNAKIEKEHGKVCQQQDNTSIKSSRIKKFTESGNIAIDPTTNLTSQAQLKKRESKSLLTENTLKSSFEQAFVFHDASKKRIAWRNSVTIASERDSLLTNSGDERSSSSQEMRPEQQNGKLDTFLEKDNNNRLTVPSPKRKGFYSTSPSTDEGIVTDDQPATDDSISPEKTASCSVNDIREKCLKEESEAASKMKLQAYNREADAIQTVSLSQSISLLTPTCIRGKTEEPKTHCTHMGADVPSLHEDIEWFQGNSKNNDSLLVDNKQYGPLQLKLSMGRNGNFINRNKLQREQFETYDETRSQRRRQLYQNNRKMKSDSSDNYHAGYYYGNPNSEPANRRKEKQIWRQASEHTPRRYLHSTKSPAHSAWNSVSSCCELGGGYSGFDDGPILLYSRSPNEIRSCESQLPALFERRESEVVAKDGSNISRIISKKSEPNHVIGLTSSLREKNNNKLPIEAANLLSTNDNSQESRKQNTREGLKLKLQPANPESDPLQTIASKHENQAETLSCDSLGQLSNASISTRDSWKNSSVNTVRLKTPSGSLRSSAIAEALSSVVVSAATGSVLRGGNEISSKEKQKSLTERLMTVGPSDSTRVQGIVEDILCEMGEERIMQYKDAFSRLDKDSSGIISSKQLRMLLRSLGHNPTDIELRELVNQVDMDENGKIDFNEFIILIGYFDKANNENEDLINIFRVFDRHDRGSIDVNDLRNVWNNFLHEITPDDTFEEMVSAIDSDGNGEINRVELLELLSTR